MKPAMAMSLSKYLKLLLLLAYLFRESRMEMVAKCPEHYIQRGETGECYLFHGGSKRTWNDANSYCQSESGNLVNIGSKSMTEWLALQIVESGLVGDSSEFWIDAIYNGNESLWYWADSGDKVELDYIPLDSREKDGDYGVITTDSTLLGHPESSMYHFICHRSISAPYYCNVEDGWHYNSGRCYMVSGGAGSWTDGEILCREISGNLVTIYGHEEQNFVFDEALRYHDNVWIGLTELGHAGTLAWIGENSSFVYWAENQSMPIYMNGKASAVVDHENENGRWVTEDSTTNNHHFVCQREKGACVTGWELHSDSCYYVNRMEVDIVTWDSANTLCSQVGAHLAIINDEEEGNYLNSQLSRGDQLWIGLYMNKSEDGFLWVDGSDYTHNYTQMSDEAETEAINAGNRKCVVSQIEHLGEEGALETWAPIGCEETRKYLCEVPAGTDVYIPSAPLDQYCPEYWDLNADYCYFFGDEERSWPDAEKYCNNYQGHLTSVGSWLEQDFIHARLKGSSWIGLNDRQQEGTYQWIDGNAITIFNWNEGEPSGYENCVEMQMEEGHWNDLTCGVRQSFVCKRDYSKTPLSPPTTTTAGPDSGNCGNDWLEDTATGICYMFVNERLSYPDARLHCLEQQHTEGQSEPNLASIVTADEQLFIQGMIASAQVQDIGMFIGLLNTPDGLHWSDGDPVGMLNYANEEPNSAYYEECTEIYNDGYYRWNDVLCETRLPFICEKKGTSYTAPTAPAPDTRCPVDGWTEFNENCYYISSNSDLKNWDEAKSACSSMYGSTLASIYSADENTFLFDAVKGGSYNAWIGLHADEFGNFTKWQDGGSIVYTNWYPNEPNNEDSKENCVELLITSASLDGEGRWNDQECSDKLRFICKTIIKTCPEGWELYDGKCYHVNEAYQTFNSSLAACQAVAGEASLLSWHSQDEDDYVQGLIDDSIPFTWVGLHREQGGSWYWVDGSETDFVNWRPGQPDSNDTEFCTVTTSDPQISGYKELDNYPCNVSFPSVCEYFPTHSVGCDDGWSKYGGYCYGPSTVLKPGSYFSYDEARTQCQSYNADLVSIWSAEEDNFVFSLVPAENQVGFFLGLRTAGTDGQMTWSDDSPLIYTDFAMLPNLPNLDCFTTGKTMEKRWQSTPCSDGQYFICKKFKTLTSLTPPASGCKNRADLYHGTSCYTEMTSLETYQLAKDDCSYRYSGHLVSIKDQFESAFLSAYYGGIGEKVWIGLQEKINSDGTITFKWDDGTEFSYSNWGEYEPYTDQGECTYASGNPSSLGLWFITSCSERFPYICEYERTGYTTQAPPTTTVGPAYCTRGWTRYSDTESCYKVFAGDLKKEGLAETSCAQYGAHLVSIHSEQEETFIRKLPDFASINETAFWTGLVLSDENGYMWLDGSPSDFLHWANGQPDSYLGRETCVSVHMDNSEWYDSYCDGFLPYICKAPQGTTVDTTPSPITNSPDVPCPDYPDERNWYLDGDQCYGVYSVADYDGMPWGDARKQCKEKKSDLVSIVTEQENSFVVSKIYSRTDTSMWIGAFADYDTGFKWSDGQPFDFVNWNIGEPNNYADQESCISLYPHNFGYWNDNNCGYSLGYICKKPAGGTAAPFTTAAPAPGHCREGWVHVGGKCIKLYSDKRAFDDAQAVCRENGVNGNLVSIHASEMQAVITVIMSTVQEPAWVGLRYREGYIWIDQTGVTYVNWGPGQPNNDYSNPCVQVVPETGLWESMDCGQNKTFFCAQNPDADLSTDFPPPMCASPLNTYINYSNSCYKPVLDPKTWKEAEDYCTVEGSHLTSIESLAENSFIYSIAADTSSPDMWTGFNSKERQNQYQWTDSFPVLYTNWGVDEPNVTNTEKRCVVLSSSMGGVWYSIHCNEAKPFVCKYNEGLIPTPEPPVDGDCPAPSWLDFGRGYCYLPVFQPTKSWQNANLECIQQGGYLVSVHSQNELNLIAQATSGYKESLWSGLIRRDEGFGWSDGSAVDFLHWAGGEPNSENEICVEMYQGERYWNDKDCGVELAYVCKAGKVGGTSNKPATGGPPATTQKPVNRNSNGLTGGAVAGIVISCLLLFTIIGLVGYSNRNKLPAVPSLPSYITRSGKGAGEAGGGDSVASEGGSGGDSGKDTEASPSSDEFVTVEGANNDEDQTKA